MEETSSALSHRFVVAQDLCTLFLELPFLSSFEGVDLDVGSEAVRIGLPGESAARHVAWPAEVAGRQDVENSTARFSRKNAQLIVKLPLCEFKYEATDDHGENAAPETARALTCEGLPSAPVKALSNNLARIAQLEQKLAQQLAGDAAKRVDDCPEKSAVTQTSGPELGEEKLHASQQLREQKVLGSGWNANSWHWEERPMIKWSQLWFEEELKSVSLPILEGLADLQFLDTADVLKGDISLCVRKGRPVVLYELSAVFRWEAKARPGSTHNTRGKIWIKDFTSEDGAVEGVDAAKIEVEVSIDTSQGRRVSKAVKEDSASHMRLMLRRFLEALVSQAAVPKV